MIVFVDVECPFCARYDETVARLRSELDSELSIGFVHYPLSQHRFAMQGALALECVRQSGRLSEFLSTAFAVQDSIGLLPWSELAGRAGVSDPLGVDDCVSRAEHRAIVDSGLAIARRLSIPGTPSVVIDGLLYSTPPTVTEVVELVRGKRAEDRD